MDKFTTTIIASIMTMFITIPIFSTIGLATEELEGSGSELWNNLSEFRQSSNLYDMLVDEGWIHKDTTFKDFDYILVMVDQLCTMNQNVRPKLVLAMIAIESRFNPYDEYHGAMGLMQITKAHKIRLENFVEADHIVTTDDFYDIRLNLATGIDYMEEILKEVDGNEEYALMYYNQGPISAARTYSKGIVSNYAKSILNLADYIKPYLDDGGVRDVSNPS